MNMPSWLVLLMLGFLYFVGSWCIQLEQDLNTQKFGMSRFEVAEKIKQCESDLTRNQHCKVIVIVEKP